MHTKQSECHAQLFICPFAGSSLGRGSCELVMANGALQCVRTLRCLQVLMALRALSVGTFFEKDIELLRVTDA